MPRPRTLAASLAVLAALAFTAGCGSTATPTPTPATAGSPSATGAESPSATPVRPPSPGTPAPSPDRLLVDSIASLPGAVVQVETTATFRDPYEGQERVTGRGSGFIVDPSGIIVTNNHVVTGADKVTVWVGPERSEYEARVVGASECSDLAVIRVDGGPFPYLDWYEGDIQPGLDIWAAGFPLGDPEYTLSRGIVSRAHGVIDEPWASVTNSIEHDANINPGSSGGPVVAEDGRVVAVDYAGNSETRQSFAISRDEAVPILSDLVAGHDIASIGINGEALGPDDIPGLRQGIWVSSVKPGSVAAKAGILPGDIVTRIDGIRLAPTGTLQEYCDVLRAHDAGDRIPVRVYREDSRETLDGVLNGKAIRPGFSFATELGDGPPSDPSALAFIDPADEPGPLSFETPERWADVVDQPWSFGGVAVGPGRVVAEDVPAFKSGWTTPGVFVAAAPSLGEDVSVEALLDNERSRFERACEYAGRAAFKRGAYRGSYDLWESCGQTTSRFLTIAATPKDGSHLVYLQFQAATPGDLAVLDRVLATLKVSLPGS